MTRAKFLKPAIAVILSPFIIAVLLETAKMSADIFLNVKITFPFTLGFLIYIPFHHYESTNSYLYVLSHELTHAVAAVLNGVKVKKISVKKNSGYVSISKNSTFISLAPYFIPFYAIIAGLVYFAADCAVDLSKYRAIFAAIIGFLTSFHLINAIDITFSGPLQSDLKKAGGKIFSFLTLIFLNCLILIIIFKILFPDLIALKIYANKIWITSAKIIEFILSTINSLILRIISLATSRG